MTATSPATPTRYLTALIGALAVFAMVLALAPSASHADSTPPPPGLPPTLPEPPPLPEMEGQTAPEVKAPEAPPVPPTEATPPSTTTPRSHSHRGKRHHARCKHHRHCAHRYWVQLGSGAGTTANFSSCRHAVYGIVWNLASLQSDGIVAAPAVYDYATGRWNWGSWTPANGISEYAVTAYRPYVLEYVLYYRYTSRGWERPLAEWNRIEADLDNGFCP